MFSEYTIKTFAPLVGVGMVVISAIIGMKLEKIGKRIYRKYQVKQ